MGTNILRTWEIILFQIYSIKWFRKVYILDRASSAKDVKGNTKTLQNFVPVRNTLREYEICVKLFLITQYWLDYPDLTTCTINWDLTVSCFSRLIKNLIKNVKIQKKNMERRSHFAVTWFDLGGSNKIVLGRTQTSRLRAGVSDLRKKMLYSFFFKSPFTYFEHSALLNQGY